MPDRGVWYVVGADVHREEIRTFRVSRIRGEIRFATRRERDFRLPAEFEIEGYRGRSPWASGRSGRGADRRPAGDRLVGRARVRPGGYSRTASTVTEYASLPMLASWVLRQDGRGDPGWAPDELRREVAESLRRVRAAHEGGAVDARTRGSRPARRR